LTAAQRSQLTNWLETTWSKLKPTADAKE
jgi:hypothetical protein